MRDEATEKLLRVLGIDCTRKNITGVVVVMKPCSMPVVTVRHALLGQHLDEVSERFALVPLDPPMVEVAPEPPPFDVDQACAQAMERITAHIDELCDAASDAIRDGARDAIVRHCLVRPVISSILSAVGASGLFATGGPGGAVGAGSCYPFFQPCTPERTIHE